MCQDAQVSDVCWVSLQCNDLLQAGMPHGEHNQSIDQSTRVIPSTADRRRHLLMMTCLSVLMAQSLSVAVSWRQQSIVTDKKFWRVAAVHQSNVIRWSTRLCSVQYNCSVRIKACFGDMRTFSTHVVFPEVDRTSSSSLDMIRGCVIGFPAYYRHLLHWNVKNLHFVSSWSVHDPCIFWSLDFSLMNGN